MHRPQLTIGAPVGRRWATIREPVLDTTVAALLWAGMAVDLATRPLTEGQSPTTPVAYVVTGLIAAPVAIHRRYPVIAMLASTAAMVGYSLGRFTAFPGYTTFVLVFLVVAVGMVRVLTQHWREGAALLGGALLLAAFLRVLLPPERVGLLAIRSRPVDVLVYLAFGGAMLVLALTIVRASSDLNI